MDIETRNNFIKEMKNVLEKFKVKAEIRDNYDGQDRYTGQSMFLFIENGGVIELEDLLNELNNNTQR